MAGLQTYLMIKLCCKMSCPMKDDLAHDAVENITGMALLINYRIYLLLGLLLLMVIPEASVQAADSALLWIDPPSQSLPAGNQAQVVIAIRNAEEVNAFDVLITYDSAILGLFSWSHGGFFQNLSCLDQSIQPGRIQLACTQVARPAVSGDGVLLTLVFDALAGGTSQVRIAEGVFANRLGVKSFPERQHGSVQVQSLPTFTHTPTSTPTQTPTRTPTPTMTATRTPTSTLQVTSGLPQAATAGKSTAVVGAQPTRVRPGETQPAWGIPESQFEQGYPIEGDQGLAADVQAATAYPASEGDAEPPNFEPAVQNEAAVETPSEGAGIMEFLLWGLLTGSGVGLFGLIGLYWFRRNRKSEDILL